MLFLPSQLLGCALLSVGVWMTMDDSASHVVQRMANMETNDEFQINYRCVFRGRVGSRQWWFLESIWGSDRREGDIQAKSMNLSITYWY